MTNNLSIMYVEDDPEILENVTFLLKRYVEDVYTAQDGEEALEVYYKYKPDIIVSDINIPKLDGLSVAKKIREENKNIPIIMMTAYNDHKKLAQAIEIGVSSYVTKPFTLDMFKNAISKAIGEKTNFAQQEDLMEKFSLINQNIIMLNTDENCIITEVTDALVELCGYSKDELIGQDATMLRSKDTPQNKGEFIFSKLQSGEVWSGEMKNTSKDGKDYWIDISITPLFDVHAKIKGYTSIQKDITKQKDAQSLIFKDKLCTLHNRLLFNEMLDNIIDLAKRYKTYFTYMAISIDDFEDYSKLYGDEKANKALKDVTSILLRNTNREKDNTFRVGGDDFSMFMLGLDEEKSLHFANKIRKDILQLQISNKDSLSTNYLSVSMGLYVARGENIADKDVVLILANNALHDSKEHGKNKVSIIS